MDEDTEQSGTAHYVRSSHLSSSVSEACGGMFAHKVVHLKKVFFRGGSSLFCGLCIVHISERFQYVVFERSGERQTTYDGPSNV
jgi:hypothetical protein